MPSQVDLSFIGTRFDRLVVVEYVGKRRWKCKCDCGKELQVFRYNLTTSHTRSCGCLRIQVHTTHGKWRTPERNVWNMMKQRCFNPNHDSYPDYGGRGITVDETWLGPTGFGQFYEDMGPRPSDKYELDRKDNNGSYCKANCQWSLPYTQKRNTRRNVWLTCNGKTQCMTDWAIELGMNKVALRHRVQHWNPADVFNVPYHGKPLAVPALN